jgi:hypothetical protein
MWTSGPVQDRHGTCRRLCRCLSRSLNRLWLFEVFPVPRTVCLTGSLHKAFRSPPENFWGCTVRLAPTTSRPSPKILLRDPRRSGASGTASLPICRSIADIGWEGRSELLLKPLTMGGCTGEQPYPSWLLVGMRKGETSLVAGYRADEMR